MFVKNILGEIQSKIENPTIPFLLMFLVVMPGTFILFATGVRDFSVLQQPGLAWSLLATGILVSISVAIGCGMFWQKVNNLSILSSPLIANRRK